MPSHTYTHNMSKETPYVLPINKNSFNQNLTEGRDWMVGRSEKPLSSHRLDKNKEVRKGGDERPVRGKGVGYGSACREV